MDEMMDRYVSRWYRVGAQFARGGDEKMKRLLEREGFYTPPETSIDYSFLTSPPLR